MPKKAGNVQENGLSLKQQRELHTLMIKATPTDMQRDIYDVWMANPRGLNRAVRRLLLSPDSQHQAALPALQHNHDTLVQLEGWERYYRDKFGLHRDFSEIFIPVRRDWAKWLIVAPQGMTCNLAFAKNAEMFECWKWTDDLDAAVKGRNNREPNRDYAIWIRGDVEPDEIAMTADQTRAIGLSGTTLLEDLLVEGKYFRETKGDHLNKQKITRCDGSRYSNGTVPGVDWRVSKVRVDWYLTDYRYDDLRPRSAAS